MRPYSIDDLKQLYFSVKEPIETRLNEFRQLWEEASEERLFEELVFCLLTPQSKAKVCWTAVEEMRRKKLLYNLDRENIIRTLKGIRFKYKKASYIISAKKFFSEGKELRLRAKLKSFITPEGKREWLVEEIKGMGFKEASHFLRNIGIGMDLAILDRHILKNLKNLGVIEQVPSSISRRRYLGIEKKMRDFSEKVGIPMAHLDLLLWYKETGEIFK